MKNKIGKLFLLEYTEKTNSFHSGKKVGIILKKHSIKYSFAKESYHVLLGGKLRVIHFPNKKNDVSYKIKFI
tara:strand:- start:639 stop:854 length:216 start_codon:yes stop_codon:yes gene_type:complete